MKIKHIVFFIFFISLHFYTEAQNIKVSSRNRRAVEAFNEAVKQFETSQFIEAEENFKRAITLDPKFIEAHQMLATLYEETNQNEKAISFYKKVIELKPSFFENNFYYLASLQLKEGLYQEAIDNFKIFQKRNRGSASLLSFSNELIDRAEFAISLKLNPVDFQPINLGANINTERGEYSPTLTADEQTLYFTVLRPRDSRTIHLGTFEEDFFISQKNNEIWNVAQPLGHPINTHGNEGASSISPDGRTFYFTACNRSDGLGSCDIYYSEKEAGRWTHPKNLGSVVNSSAWESQPTIAPDGKTLYFVSSRGGSMDIFVTVKEDGENWSNPVSLGNPINTTKSERSPFIHPDGESLYFASDGHLGMGGFDIFLSRKQADQTWSEPINIGYPINTHNDESYFIVGASGKTAIFASDQLNGFGKFDLYSFELPVEVRPRPVSYIKGTIADKTNLKKLHAEFELFDVKTGLLVVKSFSDEVDGSFLLSLPTASVYALNVSKKGYLFYSRNFELADSITIGEPKQLDILLQPISEGEIVVLRNIFFDFDSFNLKDESLVELTKLIKLLKENPNMHIEIRGHTDNKGSIEYNRVLSDNRARTVYNFLIENGINSKNLTYKGYGSSMPIDTNETEEGRANNRRTEFRVIKF